MSKTLIKTLTAEPSAYLEFVDGSDDVVFDSTYPVYEFHYVSMHPASAGDFVFQVNSTNDAGGAYDTSKITSTFSRAEHTEGGSSPSFLYSDGNDLADEADWCKLLHNIDDENYDNCSGILTIYDPSSTTYIKHFLARTSATHHSAEYTMDSYVGGYINDLYAIDEIRFKFASGNMDSGTIKMFGVS